MRRHVFVSLYTGQSVGSIETKVFAAPSGTLHFNVDAHGGELIIKDLNGDDTVLATFIPVDDDTPDVPV